MHRLSILLCLYMATGCASPVKNMFPAEPDDKTIDVYVVNHGWHTGVVIAQSNLPADKIPEKIDLENETFLEIGWGDAGFYQASKITPDLILRAIFSPSNSVVHMVGFSDDPLDFFSKSEIVKLELSSLGFDRLLDVIDQSFNRDGQLVASPKRKGLYGHSYFYEGVGSYHLFNTCNRWTADVLRAAGVGIRPFFSASAGGVMSQIKGQGDVLRSLWEPKSLRLRRKN